MEQGFMDEKQQKVVHTASQINYDYATIRITQSRIDKGLLALPVTLADWFPKHNETVEVYLNDSPNSQIKNYSSYSSSTRECRIGGLKEWFNQNKIRSGEEIVIQLIDKDKYIYKLIPEKNFISSTQELENSFDKTSDESEAKEKISSLSDWTNTNKSVVIVNEFIRLSNKQQLLDRRYKTISRVASESVPVNIRTLLGGIYKGHCQICDFWFLKKDSDPYFEIHHLDRLKGHHPKNLIVVCGNCHNQFEYASVKQDFNDDSWLISVGFNKGVYPVKQIALERKIEGFYKNLFV